MNGDLMDLKTPYTYEFLKEKIRRCNLQYFKLPKYLNETVTLYCEKHGVFDRTVEEVLRGQFVCPYSFDVKAEICNYINELGVKVELDYKCPSPLCGYDIFVSSVGLAIDIVHSKYYTDEELDILQNRIKASHENGIHLIQVYEKEWFHISFVIKNKLKHLLNKQPLKIFAKDTKVVEINNKALSNFLTQNGIIADDEIVEKCLINYALTYKGDIVAVITGFKSGLTLKLLGYYVKCDYMVVGGFSKLIKPIIEDFFFFELHFYFDCHYSNGEFVKHNLQNINGLKEVSIEKDTKEKMLVSCGCLSSHYFLIPRKEIYRHLYYVKAHKQVQRS